MRVGVAADDVSALTQVADAGGVEEGRIPDAARDDEEVAPPASAGQLVAHLQRALAPVVEGQEQMAAGRRQVDRRHELGTERRTRNRVEVPPESCPGQLVRRGAGALKPRLLWLVGDVVIGERRDCGGRG